MIAGATEALLLSLALGDRINYYRNKSDKKIKSLNEDLKKHIANVEAIVEEKTRDIKSIMTHIPQGIFHSSARFRP